MKMQRLHLLAMEEERQSLMDALLQFGRLEIRQTEDLAADPGLGGAAASGTGGAGSLAGGLPPDGGGAVGAGQPGV